MLKNIVKTLAIIFLFLFISNKISIPDQAQVSPTPIPGPVPQTWRCLKADQVGGKTKKIPKEVDINLKGAGYLISQDVYIVLCVPPTTKGGEKPKNYKCTSGNSAYDRIIFNTDLTKTILPLTIQVPKGTSPPQTVQSISDQINTTIHMSNGNGHVSYAFFGVTLNESQPVAGQAGTIQYGTFQFDQNPAGCTSIRWDPYGKVFDSQSLEPITGVRVSLLNINKQLAILPGLINPQRTERDGEFNFFISLPAGDVGTFYLNPVPLGSLPHTFKADPNLHPNYVKAYSDLYQPDDQIIEAEGVPEHRDIALDPGSNPPYHSTPISISLGSVRLGSFTRFEGTISHPLSIVTLVTKDTKIEIARTNADKNGDWEIFVPNSKIPQEELVNVQIIKVDITTLTRKPSQNLFSKVVSGLLALFNRKVSAQDVAQDSQDELQPILSYLEGYAKDKAGDIIPNAIVKVKLEMSDSIYYQTNADENGFFTINPQNLPIFSYYLEFESPNSATFVKNDLTEFTQNNHEYLASKNVNLMAATKNGEALFPTRPASSTQVVETSPGAKSSIFAGDKASLASTLFILIILLGVTAGVLMYIKKKKSQTDSLLN